MNLPKCYPKNGKDGANCIYYHHVIYREDCKLNIKPINSIGALIIQWEGLKLRRKK